MTLTVLQSGCIHFIKRPGAVLKSGCMVAHMELDDPSSIHRVHKCIITFLAVLIITDFHTQYGLNLGDFIYQRIILEVLTFGASYHYFVTICMYMYYFLLS